MTDKQAVLDALSRLPECASLAEITEELQRMTSLQQRRLNLTESRSKSQADATQPVEAWKMGWSTK